MDAINPNLRQVGTFGNNEVNKVNKKSRAEEAETPTVKNQSMAEDKLGLGEETNKTSLPVGLNSKSKTNAGDPPDMTDEIRERDGVLYIPAIFPAHKANDGFIYDKATYLPIKDGFELDKSSIKDAKQRPAKFVNVTPSGYVGAIMYQAFDANGKVFDVKSVKNKDINNAGEPPDFTSRVDKCIANEYSLHHTPAELAELKETGFRYYNTLYVYKKGTDGIARFVPDPDHVFEANIKGFPAKGYPTEFRAVRSGIEGKVAFKPILSGSTEVTTITAARKAELKELAGMLSQDVKDSVDGYKPRYGIAIDVGKYQSDIEYTYRNRSNEELSREEFQYLKQEIIKQTTALGARLTGEPPVKYKATETGYKIIIR